jgi:hypothetical protein
MRYAGMIAWRRAKAYAEYLVVVLIGQYYNFGAGFFVLKQIAAGLQFLDFLFLYKPVRLQLIDHGFIPPSKWFGHDKSKRVQCVHC